MRLVEGRGAEQCAWDDRVGLEGPRWTKTTECGVTSPPPSLHLAAHATTRRSARPAHSVVRAESPSNAPAGMLNMAFRCSFLRGEVGRKGGGEVPGMRCGEMKKNYDLCKHSATASVRVRGLCVL